jgi:hypothetical protein
MSDSLSKFRGLKPPPLGGMFLGWGVNPHPKNLAVCLFTARSGGNLQGASRNCQLSTVNCQLFNSPQFIRGRFPLRGLAGHGGLGGHLNRVVG